MNRLACICSLLVTMAIVVGCPPAASPSAPLVEAGVEVVDGSCTLLSGITKNQTVISICATVEEVATIASYVSQFLRHGDMADAGACTPLGKTGVCATAAEMGSAVQLVLGKRRLRLLLDAGVAQ